MRMRPSTVFTAGAYTLLVMLALVLLFLPAALVTPFCEGLLVACTAAPFCCALYDWRYQARRVAHFRHHWRLRHSLPHVYPAQRLPQPA